MSDFIGINEGTFLTLQVHESKTNKKLENFTGSFTTITSLFSISKIGSYVESIVAVSHFRFCFRLLAWICCKNYEFYINSE